MRTWFDEGLDYITKSEGNCSILMAYLDNTKKCGVNLEAVKMLLDHPKVDNNHRDRDDMNAFACAAMRTDDIEVYKALLEGGVDLSHHSERGPNLLKIMTGKGRSDEVMKFALENGQKADQVPDEIKE